LEQLDRSLSFDTKCECTSPDSEVCQFFPRFEFLLTGFRKHTLYCRRLQKKQSSWLQVGEVGGKSSTKFLDRGAKAQNLVSASQSFSPDREFEF
jgi:hypothetical protein